MFRKKEFVEEKGERRFRKGRKGFKGGNRNWEPGTVYRGEPEGNLS